MKNSNINIQLEDIRAVQKADIVLDGITVISGENGCGKSTISKLAYHFLLTTINFNGIIKNRLNNYFENMMDFFNKLVSDYSLNIFLSIPEYMFLAKYKNNDIAQNYERLMKLMDSLKEGLESIRPPYKSSEERLRRILSNEIEENTANDTLDTLLEKLKKQIEDKYKEFDNFQKERPLNILNERINKAFYDNPIEGSFDFIEYGESLIDRDRDKLLNIHSIEKVAYIDTPMIVGLETSNIIGRQHWADIYKLTTERNNTSNFDGNARVNNIIKNEILNGDIDIEDELGSTFLSYQREDKNIFNLFECATGLKSFSLLHLLYKNNFLSDKTLLIIDEPEVHLHPQWVVEYARLIVLLNKELGVKFLLASHHPDMISAIKYIYLKENEGNNKDNLNFYLAEKATDYQYSYKCLKTDIDEIFKSFNISLERIEQYGAFDE